MNSAKRVRQMAMIVLVSAALAIVRAAVCAPASSAAPTSTLDVLRLDYAYYNPVSLVLRRQQWIEQEFARDGTRVEWVVSLGSNKAKEHTASGGVQFGSTGGCAALVARANGRPVMTVLGW